MSPEPAFPVSFRAEVGPEDRARIRDIVASSGFFYPGEIEVAVELVDERLSKGKASGYHFVLADLGGRTVGYACFGPIACTQSSYDLYWIAVHRDFRTKGLGRRLIDRSERAVAAQGGCRIYVETSSRIQYEPTRAFYRHMGYVEQARLADFYGPGDDKVICVKVL
jgi:GNAT superfamily N-acetyltransferase